MATRFTYQHQGLNSNKSTRSLRAKKQPQLVYIPFGQVGLHPAKAKRLRGARQQDSIRRLAFHLGKSICQPKKSRRVTARSDSRTNPQSSLTCATIPYSRNITRHQHRPPTNKETHSNQKTSLQPEPSRNPHRPHRRIVSHFLN